MEDQFSKELFRGTLCCLSLDAILSRGIEKCCCCHSVSIRAKKRASESYHRSKGVQAHGMRIEHLDFGWFDFPLTSGRSLRKNGLRSLKSLLRFPEGEAHECSFFRVLKNVRDEHDSWLLFHQFVKLEHLLNPDLLLFRQSQRIMYRVKYKYGSIFLTHFDEGFASLQASISK